jgi:hypothetical protein
MEAQNILKGTRAARIVDSSHEGTGRKPIFGTDRRYRKLFPSLFGSGRGGTRSMHPFLIDWEPSRRHLRTFAWSLALVLALLSWWCGGSVAGLSLRWCAAAIFALGAVRPRLFRLLFVLSVLSLYALAWALQAIRILPARRQDSSVG